MLDELYSIMPVIVKTIERVHDNSWSMDYNEHENYEFVYVKKGQLRFTIIDETVNLKNGEILIIKPNTRHKFEVIGNIKAEFIVLGFHIKESYRLKMNQLYEIYGFIFEIDKHKQSYYNLKVRKKSDVFLCLEHMLNEAKNNKESVLQHLKILELFVYITREVKKFSNKALQDSTMIAKEVKKIIDENYQEDLRIGMIARQYYISESALCRIFKKEFKMLPKDYLLSKRIEKAKEYLLNGNLKIGEIALICGFSSIQRFNDIFKKYIGVSPRQYRNKQN
ncbi:helix-turn-helix domain-containing protein [Caldicellulosiruptoraceae bacterium PP1]